MDAEADQNDNDPWRSVSAEDVEKVEDVEVVENVEDVDNVRDVENV